jgi:hypothetical protein
MMEKILSVPWNSLKFERWDSSMLVALICGAIFILALVIRYFRKDIAGRKKVILPAVLPIFRRSHLSFIRHIPITLFLVGLPLFFIALADPYVNFVKEDVTYPGRRIAILLDASSSMRGNFVAQEKIKPKIAQRFFTATATAEYFMQLRINGEYKDLMSLIEFGNESYVITPFTNDYQNILTSIKLISEPEEWSRFPDGGTTIIKAINQSVELFRTFGFLKVSGNLMILISDGEDPQNKLENQSLDDILSEARKNNIPIYFIRTNYQVPFGYTTDTMWKNAVEKTGGKFYTAVDEASIIQAVTEIDKVATGSISISRYSTKKPLFDVFIKAVLLLWGTACLLTLSLRYFRKFP